MTTLNDKGESQKKQINAKFDGDFKPVFDYEKEIGNIKCNFDRSKNFEKINKRSIANESKRTSNFNTIHYNSNLGDVHTNDKKGSETLRSMTKEDSANKNFQVTQDSFYPKNFKIENSLLTKNFDTQEDFYKQNKMNLNLVFNKVFQPKDVKSQVDNLEIQKQQNDPNFWRKRNKNAQDRPTTTFGNEVRKDIYSDQHGNIIQKTSTFGTLTKNEDCSARFNTKLQAQRDILSSLNTVQKRAATIQNSVNRKFELEMPFSQTISNRIYSKVKQMPLTRTAEPTIIENLSCKNLDFSSRKKSLKKNSSPHKKPLMKKLDKKPQTHQKTRSS